MAAKRRTTMLLVGLALLLINACAPQSQRTADDPHVACMASGKFQFPVSDECIASFGSDGPMMHAFSDAVVRRNKLCEQAMLENVRHCVQDTTPVCDGLDSEQCRKNANPSCDRCVQAIKASSSCSIAEPCIASAFGKPDEADYQGELCNQILRTHDPVCKAEWANADKLGTEFKTDIADERTLLQQQAPARVVFVPRSGDSPNFWGVNSMQWRMWAQQHSGQ